MQMFKQRVDRAATAGRGDRQCLRDRRGHQFRILDGCQGYEVDTVRELIHDIGRDLQAEPCLARAAGAGECQQPGSAQQLPTLTHLVVAADETRHLRGQVVRCGFQGAQCRKFARQPVDVELVQPFRTGEIFEPMQPEVLEGQAGWKHVIDERARRFRDEHLAAVRRAGDPGGAVDIEAEVLVTDERRLAGVQPDAHLNAPSLRPGMRLQSLLRRCRAAAGIQRAAEHDEE